MIAPNRFDQRMGLRAAELFPRGAVRLDPDGARPGQAHQRRRIVYACLLTLVAWSPVRADGGVLPDNDVMMKAIVAELERSMNLLHLDDLPKPYFIRYNAQDRLSFTMQAAYGGLSRNDRNRFRAVASRVRVGSPELDNTNIGRGFGGRAVLPLDDNLTALRHEIWKTTDSDYKQAVEMLARKRAYLKQKMIEDRPDDFGPAEPIVAIEPSAEIAFDRKEWEHNVRLLSARFKKFSDIQDSDVSFFAGAVNEWVVNSEGTRIRKADTGVHLEMRAEIQADDGMPLTDSRSYLGLYIDQLPPMEKMLADVDEMCTELIALSKAPILEQYTGPVLFEPVAAGKVFHALLAEGLCAKPPPLGAGGSADDSLEKKIGLRILPRSFSVYDDPGEESYEGTVLAGSYRFDDEGVRPQRVNLVEKGILKTLLAGRSPTKKIKKTTGHARSAGFSDPQATIGCLYLADKDALPREELRHELIQAAREEGLEYALRVSAIQSGGFGNLGDPIYAYKVFVEDGHEELVRGLKFLSVPTRALKRILAGGEEREVYNASFGVTSSVIAPAVVFEELELNRTDSEFDKLPFLKSPANRAQK